MIGELPGVVWWIIAVALPLTLVGVVLAAAAQPGDKGPVRALAVGLLLWFGAAVVLGAVGVFHQSADAPVPLIGLGIGLPLLLGIGVLLGWPALRERLLRIPQPLLIGIQTLRAVGVVFLLAMGAGVLPGAFALPAGWGDVAVGLTAPLVALAWARGARSAPAWALLWNAVGVLDLVVAVGVGFLAGANPYRVFLVTPPTDAMTVFPLVLVPTFGVPLYLLLHGLSLVALRRSRREACGPMRPQAMAV